MTNIGDHGLTCLDDSAYGAIALSMQANANAINDALLVNQAAYSAYGGSYIRQFTTTSASTGIGANSGTVLPDGTAAQSLILATLGASLTGGSGSTLGILPRGWYSASASMTYQESGAVTANTYRRAVLSVNLEASGLLPKLFQATTGATNTASADSMTVNGWFYSDASTAVTLWVLFGHGNTGSTMNVAAGVTLTVRHLSSGLVT